MKKHLLLIPAAALLLSGCAVAHYSQVHETFNENGKLLSRTTTHGGASTVLAADSALANWSASQSTNGQVSSLGSLNQSAPNTNAVGLATAIGQAILNYGQNNALPK